MNGVSLFNNFDKSSLDKQLTERQKVAFTKTLVELLIKKNKNRKIDENYFVENLKIVEDSVKFQPNSCGPLISIMVKFVLADIYIDTQFSVTFNHKSCYIPLTYSHYKLILQHTADSGLFKLLNLYTPATGVSSLQLDVFRLNGYRVTNEKSFKFEHLFNGNFYINYEINDNGHIVTTFFNEDFVDLYTETCKSLPATEETLFIKFANLLYTRQSEEINRIVTEKFNFNTVSSLVRIKQLFINLADSHHREMILNEILIDDMRAI